MSETTINQPAKMISIKELFKLSLAVYPTIFWKTFKILILPLLVLVPVGIIISLTALVNYASLNANLETALFVVLAVLGLVGVIFFIVVMYIAQIAAMIVVQKNDPHLGVKEALLLAKGQAFSFLKTSLLAGLFVLLWALLFIIPGLVMCIYYTFISWAVLSEGLSGKKALERSKDLVRNYWWAVFWRSILPTIIIGIVFGILSAMLVPPATPGMPVEYTAGQRINDLLTQIISLVITPFFVAYSYNMYKSLVAIKDKKV